MCLLYTSTSSRGARNDTWTITEQKCCTKLARTADTKIALVACSWWSMIARIARIDRLFQTHIMRPPTNQKHNHIWRAIESFCSMLICTIIILFLHCAPTTQLRVEWCLAVWSICCWFVGCWFSLTLPFYSSRSISSPFHVCDFQYLIIIIICRASVRQRTMDTIDALVNSVQHTDVN